MKRIRPFIMSALLVFLVNIGLSAQEDAICSKGPAELNKAGGSWFISIAGSDWTYVGKNWERVEELISGTPLESAHNRRKALYYAGGASVAGLGGVLFFVPTQACILAESNALIACEESARTILSPVLAFLGLYWILNVEEMAHTAAVRDFNEVYQLVCT